MSKLYFLGGLLVGGLTGFFAAKKYYEQVKEDELARQREYYESGKGDSGSNADGSQEDGGQEEKSAEKEDKSGDRESKEEKITRLKNYQMSQKEVRELVERHGYDESRTVNPGVGEYADEIEIISPEEYATGQTYADVSLTWYERDGVLVYDEWNDEDYNTEVVLDVENTVGVEWKERFSEFEEDTVYVRNHKTATDYTITREETAYEID